MRRQCLYSRLLGKVGFGETVLVMSIGRVRGAWVESVCTVGS
jgi:hypothetical protein